MSFEQEKMIVGSLPSLYPLQKFEEEAINALVSLPIDDDTISRAKAIEALDKRFDSIPMEQTSEILMLRKDLRELPPAQQPMPSNTSNALEALDSVNATQSNTLDCISRQAAIDAVQNRPMMLSKEKVLPINDLEKLPSAEPKRIRGRWIVEKDCEGKTRTCICDQCGYKTGRFQWENPNFCANCGAKMEREVSDE